MLFPDKSPLTDLYRAEKLRLEKEMGSVKSNIAYLSRVDASGGQDLLDLAELRKCVALAKFGRGLSTAQQVDLLRDKEVSKHETYVRDTDWELSRAFEIRDALLERGVTFPEEDLTFLSHQESLLRK